MNGTAMAARDTNLPTRVSVLEHGVQELKTGLDGARTESRQGFVAVQAALDRLSSDVAARAQPTNWGGLVSAAAAAVVIFSSIFGLAEWRVAQSTNPIITALAANQAWMRNMAEQIVELRVNEAALRTKMLELDYAQQTRTRARIEAGINPPSIGPSKDRLP